MSAKSTILIVSGLAAVAVILTAHAYKKGLVPPVKKGDENNSNAAGPASVYNPSGTGTSTIYAPSIMPNPVVGVPNVSRHQGGYNPRGFGRVVYGGGGLIYPYVQAGLCVDKDIYGNTRTVQCGTQSW